MTEPMTEHTFCAKGVGGVAYDGRNIWVGLFAENGRNVLAAVDLRSGQIQRELTEVDVASGTTWDGTHLWQIGRQGLQRINPTDGKVVRELPRPHPGFLSGLGWDGEFLWVGVHDEKLILKVCPESGKVLREVRSDKFVTGVAWVGTQLWHGAATSDVNSGNELRRVCDKTGQMLAAIPVNHHVTGMSFDGEKMWCGNCCGEAALRSYDFSEISTQERGLP